MSAAAPAYLRTVHSSFSAAAHPTWAAASINSHNQNTYQHHLHQHPVPIQYHPRPRSATRHVPLNPPTHKIKFDPFADESPILTAAAPPQTPSPRTPLYSHSRASLSSPSLSPTPKQPTTEIQRYHYGPRPSPRRFTSFHSPPLPPPPSPPSPLPPSRGAAPQPGPPRRLPPIGGTVPQRPPLPTRASPPPPSRIDHKATGPISPPPRTSSNNALSNGTNMSKLVAGILLNRVHAVGKPMRRRFAMTDKPREYVKSSLSTVVSVGA